MSINDLTPEQQAEAFGIVIPEYEQRLASASSRGDNAEIARISDEYAGARADKWQERQPKDESQEPVNPDNPEPVNPDTNPEQPPATPAE